GRQKAVFEINVPVELAVAFPVGKIVTGTYGDQVMWGLDFPENSVMYLDLAVAKKITDNDVQPGERFFLCKRQQQGTRKILWDFWLSPATEQARAIKAHPDAAIHAPAARAAAAAAPAPAPEQPTLLERQLAA